MARFHAVVLTVLSLGVIAQPVLLPMLAGLVGRRMGPWWGWLSLALLPAFALPAIAVGLMIGLGDLMDPPSAQLLQGPRFVIVSSDVVAAVAPILLLCLVPSALFAIGWACAKGSRESDPTWPRRRPLVLPRSRT